MEVGLAIQDFGEIYWSYPAAFQLGLDEASIQHVPSTTMGLSDLSLAEGYTSSILRCVSSYSRGGSCADPKPAFSGRRAFSFD